MTEPNVQQLIKVMPDLQRFIKKKTNQLQKTVVIQASQTNKSF